MAAENYHLKWDSHLSYLNSSVATLYKNEKFADVVLYSSNSSSSSGSGNGTADNIGIPTVGISAHKFILSSCSQFFATMFETSPITAPNGGVLYVVLPPDLSHRAIQILVQYMYSGEATVSNDILSEVLRGGEILKIRGLCRTSSATQQQQLLQREQPPPPPTSSSNNSAHHHQHHHHHHYGTNGTRPLPLPPVSHTQQLPDLYAAAIGKCPPRYSIESSQQQQQQQQQHPSQQQQQQQQHQQFRGLGASVMPKDSPVIVKSPKMPQMGLLAPSGSNGKPLHSAGGNVGGISVNKEVAIDPDEKCCYQLSHEPLPLPLIATGGGGVASALCNEVGCSSCPMVATSTTTTTTAAAAATTTDAEALMLQHRRQQQLQRQRQSTPPSGDEHATTSSIERLERSEYAHGQPPDENEADAMAYEHGHGHGVDGSGSGLRRCSDYFVPEHYEHSAAIAAASRSINNNNSKLYGVNSATVGARLSQTTPPLPHAHSFLAIKQEPTDWSLVTTANSSASAANDSDSRPSTPLHSPKQPLDFKMPLGGAAVKLEACPSAHSADEEEPGLSAVVGGGIGPVTAAGAAVAEYDNFTRLACDVCKKSFDDPKTWVRHLETHATTTTTTTGGGIINSSSSHQHQQSTTITAAASNGGSGGSGCGGGDPLTKTYVPKKRRRVSQQENSMDHVTLLCDLCATSFETPAEWVRHMNNQHTEIELAIFNSKRDSEQKTNSTSASATVTTCSTAAAASSSIHHHQQHQQQPHHHHHQQSHKKYSNRTSSSTSLSYSAAASVAEHLERICDICNKKFASHSNMLLHKRSHTANGSVNSNASSLSSSPVPAQSLCGAGGGTTTSTAVSQIQSEQLNATTSSQA